MLQFSRPIITTTFCSALALLVLQFGVAFSEEKTTAKGTEVAMQKPSSTTVLAKVNGVAITQGERDQTAQEMLSRGRMSQQQSSPDMLPKIEAAALQQLINVELLYQKGQKLKIKDLDKKVDDKLAQMRAQFPSPADFEKALTSANLTEKQFKAFTRKNIVIDNLLQKEVLGKISVSEADAKKFYDENQDKFKAPEQTKASHVLITVDQKATPEEKKKAREKADAIRKRVAGGEDFATLAKAESKCPSAAKGGDLGYFGKGQMVPAFEEAAASLKPGQISDVVETQFGYHIIKVTDRKQAETVKFNDVKGKIEDYLKNQEAQNPMADYVENLRKQAKIEMVK
jgi:peptidyl-prolyl cis-trans isomerase C